MNLDNLLFALVIYQKNVTGSSFYFTISYYNILHILWFGIAVLTEQALKEVTFGSRSFTIFCYLIVLLILTTIYDPMTR